MLNEQELQGLTHDEQVALALAIMADGPRRDRETGRKWQASQRRTVVIKEREK
jgi:hypothetical protein